MLLPDTSSALHCYVCSTYENKDQWLCNYTQGENTSVFACKMSDAQRRNCSSKEVTIPGNICTAWAEFTCDDCQHLPLPNQDVYNYIISEITDDSRDPAPMRCPREFNESDFISIIDGTSTEVPQCTCNSSLCNDELKLIILHPTIQPSTSLSDVAAAATATTSTMLHMTPTPYLEPEEHVHVAAYIIPSLLLAMVIAVVCIGAALLCWCNALHRQNNSNRSEFEFPKGGDVMVDLTDLSSAKRPMLSRGQLIQVQELSLTVVEMVGRGRFGTVWKAVDKKGLTVAVKVFGYKDEPSWRNERYFYRLPSTSHPHVLEYIASDRKGSDLSAQYYMASSYCQCGSLSNYLENHTIPWNMAMNIIRCIASALAHLHGDHWVNASGEVVEKSPIAHRDVKSSNVLLTSSQGDCVLSDFGLALELTTSMKQLELANSGQVRLTLNTVICSLHRLCVLG